MKPFLSLAILILTAHVTSLKCWLGSGAYIYQNRKDHVSIKYCAILKYINSNTTVHSNLTEDGLTKFNSTGELVSYCQTEYCNKPPYAPPAFTQKINAASEPSKGDILCWETHQMPDLMERGIFYTEPKKSTVSKGKGFCSIMTFYPSIADGQKRYIYDYTTVSMNANITDLGYIVEYDSCNTDYCNNPNGNLL